MDLLVTSQPYFFGFILILWVTLSFVSTRKFLYLTGFLVPLMLPRVDVGVAIDMSKIMGPGALLLLIFRPRRAQVAWPKGMSTFISYAVGVSGIWMVLEYTILRRHLEAAAMGLGAGQSLYKMPVQLGSFLCQLLLVYVVPARAGSRDEAMAAVRGFAAGALFSVGVGILLYATTGQGMIGTRGMGMVNVEGLDLSRIGGLSGEPKFLGVMLGVLISWELSKALFGKGNYLILGGAAIGLVLTFSTSAWAGVFVAATALMWASIRHSKRVRWRVWLLCALSVLLVGFSTLTAAVFSRRFGDRVFGEKSELGRQKDSLLLGAYRDTPVHAIYGFGLGGGDLAVMPYIPPEEKFYRRTPTPGVAAARILGDLGVAGFILLIGMCATWASSLFKMRQYEAGAFALAGIAAALMGSLLALSAYFLLMGALLAASSFASGGPTQFRPRSMIGNGGARAILSRRSSGPVVHVGQSRVSAR